MAGAWLSGVDRCLGCALAPDAAGRGRAALSGDTAAPTNPNPNPSPNLSPNQVLLLTPTPTPTLTLTLILTLSSRALHRTPLPELPLQPRRTLGVFTRGRRRHLQRALRLTQQNRLGPGLTPRHRGSGSSRVRCV